MAMSLSRATKPGAFVRRRGLELRLRSTALMWSAMALTILALAHAGALGVPLFLLAVYLGVRGHRQHGLSKRWLAGARAERAVGRALRALAGEGCVVMHDIDTGRGNVDHLVAYEDVTFAVETKYRRFEPSHLDQARRGARRMAHDYHRPCHAVICLAYGASRLEQQDGVWIVSRDRVVGLVRWLERRGRTPLGSPETLRA